MIAVYKVKQNHISNADCQVNESWTNGPMGLFPTFSFLRGGQLTQKKVNPRGLIFDQRVFPAKRDLGTAEPTKGKFIAIKNHKSLLPGILA